MLILKLLRGTILASLLAVLCAIGNAGVAESTVQICNKHADGFRISNHGTGFVYAAGGYVLTAKHVTDCCRNQIMVRDYQGRFHEATLVALGSNDWSCVYAPTLKEAPLPVRTSVVPVQREMVTAYGDFRTAFGFGSLEQAPGYVKNSLVQKDCQNFTGDVRPGFSGGPVLDANGCVVGIVSWENIITNDSGFVRITDVFRRKR